MTIQVPKPGQAITPANAPVSPGNSAEPIEPADNVEADDDEYYYEDESERIPLVTWLLPVVIAIAAFIAGGLIFGGIGSSGSPSATKTVVAVESVAPVQVVTTVTVTVGSSANSFGNGMHLVGTDIAAGTYKTTAAGVDGTTIFGCYYAVLSTPDTSDVSHNVVIATASSVVLTTGKYFETGGGCAWTKA